jgi:hypothetical protein
MLYYIKYLVLTALYGMPRKVMRQRTLAMIQAANGATSAEQSAPQPRKAGLG